MITFIVSALLLLVVAPTAIVVGVRFAWFIIKKMSRKTVKAIGNWPNDNP